MAVDTKGKPILLCPESTEEYLCGWEECPLFSKCKLILNVEVANAGSIEKPEVYSLYGSQDEKGRDEARLL